MSTWRKLASKLRIGEANTKGNTGVVLQQEVKIKDLIWSPDEYLENGALRPPRPDIRSQGDYV